MELTDGALWILDRGQDDVEAHRGPAIAVVHRPARIAGLTEREVEVLQLAARGHSTREIGRLLSISPKTADHHIQHGYTKIGVSTRAGAAIFAMEHGLVQSGGPSEIG